MEGNIHKLIKDTKFFHNITAIFYNKTFLKCFLINIKFKLILIQKYCNLCSLNIFKQNHAARDSPLKNLF